MIFDIYWGRDVNNHNDWSSLFDIEYFQKKSDVPGKYYTDIRVLPDAQGLLRFFDSKKDDANFNKEEFIQDCVTIQELRGLLFEVLVYTIKDDSHYGERYKYIRNIIDKFVEKYDLYLKID